MLRSQECSPEIISLRRFKSYGASNTVKWCDESLIWAVHDAAASFGHWEWRPGAP